ncbi:hypothetical protein [Streptomyces sp. XD-27]|uniref:hypothetical protein n=1 Tax=Streptomyces sp. XD-27 TaxID=3062779 RepID=UPI0026F41305|nr:hypothetical protein [Streptomyces sp. XD-27]WKX73270.1 hypothetical protein Q3Y56_28255 [Streptomyces sp. XD-27]
MSATQLTTRPQSVDATAARTWLRRFLALDAVVTGGNGLAYLALSGPLGDLLGVDRTLLVGLGAFLTAFAAAVGYLASRPQPPALGVRFVVESNLLWAALSIAALALWLSPTTAGTVWIPMQAATVAGFATLQYGALRAALRT